MHGEAGPSASSATVAQPLYAGFWRRVAAYLHDADDIREETAMTRKHAMSPRVRAVLILGLRFVRIAPAMTYFLTRERGSRG